MNCNHNVQWIYFRIICIGSDFGYSSSLCCETDINLSGIYHINFIHSFFKENNLLAFIQIICMLDGDTRYCRCCNLEEKRNCWMNSAGSAAIVVFITLLYSLNEWTACVIILTKGFSTQPVSTRTYIEYSWWLVLNKSTSLNYSFLKSSILNSWLATHCAANIR